MKDRRPAEVFSPGEYIADEIEARGWTVAEFAAASGLTAQLVQDIIAGKALVTEATAAAIAGAVGTSAQVWMNLEHRYRTALASQRA